MPIARNLLLQEPGVIIFDGATLYSQGPLTVKPVVTNASIVTAIHGTVDRGRATDRLFTVSGTLAGEWRDLAVLFHALSVPIGGSVFGASDKPLVVHGRSGTRVAFVNGAITRPPTIVGRAGTTLFGEFEATCVLGNGLDPAATASYYAITSATYPGDAAFDPTSLITLPLNAVWGTEAPWVDFHTLQGWTVTPEVTLTPHAVDGLGTVDMKVTDKQVTAAAVPAGVTQAQILSKLGFGGGLGARRSGGPDLVLSADGVYIAISDAVMLDSELAFGAVPIIGNTVWSATRTFTEGAERPLLVVADAPPAPPEEEEEE
jgi:hypothetical protein